MSDGDDFGPQIVAAMERLRLSNRKAARLCGITRRWMATAAAGDDRISLAILKKIATGLAIRDLKVGVVSVTVTPADRPELAVVFAEVQAALAALTRVAEILQSHLAVGEQEPPERDRDHERLIARGAAIMQDIRRYVEDVHTNGQSDLLRNAINETIEGADHAPPAAKPVAKRRRRSA